MLENLRKYNVLLASGSPRRRELLTELRVPFRIVTMPGLKENYPDTLPVREVPEFLANQKADAYHAMVHDNEMIITADTVVILDDEILGKPKSESDAKAMLRKLSGRTHEVVTGVCITTKDRRESFSVSTLVTFSELTDEEITYYVDNYQPFDKAGAYGIQEWIGCVAIQKIDGSYYNVMGLPVNRLYRALRSF